MNADVFFVYCKADTKIRTGYHVYPVLFVFGIETIFGAKPE